MSLVIKTNFSKLQMYMIRKINREKERGIKGQNMLVMSKLFRHVWFI